MTASDKPSVIVTTRSCSERRHASAILRPIAARPRINGADRRWIRRLELKITTTAERLKSRRSGLVSHSSNGEHYLRVLRVFLDFGPQTLDMHVHQTGISGVTVTPHLF